MERSDMRESGAATVMMNRNGGLTMRLFPLALIGLAMLSASPQRAAAEDYPTRNVTFLVPFAPGGGTDVLARLVGQKLEQRFGKSFIVENRPGAGTTIAAGATAKAAPDGYTLMQATSGTMAMNPTIFKHLPYTPEKDLVPVSLITGVPFVLVVHPDLKVKTVAELVKLAKEKPLTYGSGGVGAFHHLNAELFSSMTGIKMTHVPYKGSVPSMTALIAHEIDVLFVDLGPSIQLIRAGKAVALGVTSAETVASAPEIPPLQKVGLPGFDTTAWQMIVAPGSTPKPILEKLNTGANAAVNEPDLHKKLSDMGMIPLGKKSLPELDAFVKSETAKWAPVIRNAGLAGSQ
jgi:tripartite-type tricarboxylate transporter receptor subunit TctC